MYVTPNIFVFPQIDNLSKQNRDSFMIEVNVLTFFVCIFKWYCMTAYMSSINCSITSACTLTSNLSLTALAHMHVLLKLLQAMHDQTFF